MVLYKYPYKMELVRTADAYKPGMPYTAYLKVANQDDSPVADDLNLVSVKWGFTRDPESYNMTEYTVPDDGIIELIFDTPKVEIPDEEANSVLGIEATYKSLTQWFSTIPRAASPSGNYIQARLRTLNPSVGSNVRIGIVTTEPIQWITYQVPQRVLQAKIDIPKQSLPPDLRKRKVGFCGNAEGHWQRQQ